MRDIFRYIGDDPDHKWNVTCSYLEVRRDEARTRCCFHELARPATIHHSTPPPPAQVYNEVIYDLLVPDSDGLELR